jgi:hypothetical protein
VDSMLLAYKCGCLPRVGPVGRSRYPRTAISSRSPRSAERGLRRLRIGAINVLVATFGVLALSVGTSAASAKTPCWRQIQNEWVNNQSIATTYPLHCYREAIAHVPEDLRQYSSIEEDILSARQLAATAEGSDPAFFWPSIALVFLLAAGATWASFRLYRFRAAKRKPFTNG